MDFQTKLESLHSEIVSALCCIREMPENLLPFSIFVEEETDESLASGHSVYNQYSLTEIFADGTCILENPDTGKEEKRTLNEISIDHLTELWNMYRHLYCEEAVNKANCLLQSMEPIAKSLITGRYITDFLVHDTNLIRTSYANRPFIWLVYQSGTHLHFIDKKQEILHLKNRLDFYEKFSDTDLYLFRYDGHILFPVFQKVLRGWIENQLKNEN